MDLLWQCILAVLQLFLRFITPYLAPYLYDITVWCFRFLGGDFVWSMPTIFAALVMYFSTFWIKRWWLRTLIFLVGFIGIVYGGHHFVEPYLERFHAWWLCPLGWPLS